MERAATKPVPTIDADEILRELTVRQHLAPDLPLAEVVAELVERSGACPVAAERAMERLELDGARPIGRLKRGELIQFARGMYRLWRSAGGGGRREWCAGPGGRGVVRSVR